jgi:hypothetical protein
MIVAKRGRDTEIRRKILKKINTKQTESEKENGVLVSTWKSV